MKINQIHSFLVYPAKGEPEQPTIGGTQVPKQGKLHDMLALIFGKAELECDIEIVFRPDDEGLQRNVCRDELVAYLGKPTVANGRILASRLQQQTTHRSGLGLLFLMTGEEGTTIRLVISRFPADQGIIAEQNSNQLSVEFIERVFMKSAKAYKSVFYQSDSLERGFWDGRAVDRQVSGPKELSDYWIRDFLMSDLRTTGPAKRLAVAVRDAIRSADSLTLRQELVSAAGLLRHRDGNVASGRQLVDQLGLSEEAISALEHELPRRELMDEVFEFDGDEFDKHVLYRLVELDNGGLLLAEDQIFDEVFQRTFVDGSGGVERFSTEGRVIDERLRKSR